MAATQDVMSPGKPYYGGIKGSLPIYGRYAPLQYPNWATKFFIDALLAKQRTLSAPIDRHKRVTRLQRPHQRRAAVL